MSKAEKVDVIAEANHIEEIVEGSNLFLRCPPGYKIDKTGIYRLDKKINEYVIFSGNPILINRNLIDIESNTVMTEIKYYMLGSWKKVTLPRTTLLNDYSVISIVDLGIQLQKSNGKYLTDFLSNLELINDIKVDKSSDRLGWQGKYFLPTDKDKLHIYAEGAMKQWLNAFEEKGKLNDWIEKVTPYRSNNIFRFILASSFSAPLLKIVNSRSAIIHLWATSRAGKTAALKCAMSVWGDPNRITTTFNTTKVGLERLSAFFCDMPVGMDEKQAVGSNQDFINNLIYMLGGSTSRMRGNKIGGIDEVKTWRNIVITTGEEPITSERTNTGISSRMVEINGVPFEDEKKARKMYDIILNNYGTAGNYYIKELKKLNKKDIRNEVNLYRDQLIEKRKEISGSNLEVVSMVRFADVFISQILFNETKEQAIKNADRMVEEVIEGIESKEDMDITNKAYEFLVSWCVQNEPAFNGENRFTQYGVVQDSNKKDKTIEYCIFPNIFDDILREQGYYPKKIKTELAERGLINSGKETFDNYTRNRYSVLRTVNRKKTRMIVLNVGEDYLKEVNEFSIDAEEE